MCVYVCVIINDEEPSFNSIVREAFALNFYLKEDYMFVEKSCLDSKLPVTDFILFANLNIALSLFKEV